MVRDVSRKVRLPVRFVEGQWELASGGAVPAVEGAEAEITLLEGDISDAAFLDRYSQRSHIKILPFGTALRACVNVKNEHWPTDELARHLISWNAMRRQIPHGLVENWSSNAYSFVEVFIGPATERQSYTDDMHDGGLWLTIRGNKAEALTASQIRLPDDVSRDHAISLNHAFTLLSEVYEPWRKAHTGNVYDRFLYQEADGLWYPLKLLRDASVAKEEQKIAYDLWKAFLAAMSRQR